MKLLKVFNQNYLEVLRIINKSFDDVRQLSDELGRAEKAICENESYKEIHNEFREDVNQSVMDRIFEKDKTVITSEVIRFLKRSCMSLIYERMFQVEKDVFWKNLQSLCRYSSMLRACGEQLTDMEEMAMNFMQNNSDCKPENYHMRLFQEMLSGGEMSKKLMSTFKNPDCIKNILSNVGNIMKVNGGGEDADLSDFASLLNMPFSESDMAEVAKGVQDTLSKNIDEVSDEPCEAKGDEPCEAKGEAKGCESTGVDEITNRLRETMTGLSR